MKTTANNYAENKFKSDAVVINGIKEALLIDSDKQVADIINDWLKKTQYRELLTVTSEDILLWKEQQNKDAEASSHSTTSKTLWGAVGGGLAGGLVGAIAGAIMFPAVAVVAPVTAAVVGLGAAVGCGAAGHYAGASNEAAAESARMD